MASIHNSLEFFDGFVFFDGLTGLLDLSFDGLAGLTDLSLIDDLDLIRFLCKIRYELLLRHAAVLIQSLTPN